MFNVLSVKAPFNNLPSYSLIISVSSLILEKEFTRRHVENVIFRLHKCSEEVEKGLYTALYYAMYAWAPPRALSRPI